MCTSAVSAADINLVAFLAFRPEFFASSSHLSHTSAGAATAATANATSARKIRGAMSEKAENSNDTQKSKRNSAKPSERPAETEADTDTEAETATKPTLYDIATAGNGIVKFFSIRGFNLTQECGEYNNAASGAAESNRITQVFQLREIFF
jgi:hypothetical protein